MRLTGGEPLLRQSLVDVVAGIATLKPRPLIAMTTNGVGLGRLAPTLTSAGLDRVNVSLDAVDQQEFFTLTGRDSLAGVEAGSEGRSRSRSDTGKANAVAMRGISDHSAADVLAWCLERGYQLRFIEQMPLDAQHQWQRDQMVSAAEIHGQLSTRFELTPMVDKGRGSAPAELFLVDGGPATVGVIAGVSAPFCAACDRVRLTSDGQVRNSPVRQG